MSRANPETALRDQFIRYLRMFGAFWILLNAWGGWDGRGRLAAFGGPGLGGLALGALDGAMFILLLEAMLRMVFWAGSSFSRQLAALVVITGLFGLQSGWAGLKRLVEPTPSNIVVYSVIAAARLMGCLHQAKPTNSTSADFQHSSNSDDPAEPTKRIEKLDA